MAISLQAFNGNDASVLLQLAATVQGKAVSILVDSGSSASFINARLVSGLSGVCALTKPVRVKIANGVELQCIEEVVDCPWEVQQHHFSTTYKILPLGGFDMILGMDWLEKHNPHIDWVTKQLSFAHDQGSVCLQGQQSLMLHVHRYLQSSSNI